MHVIWPLQDVKLYPWHPLHAVTACRGVSESRCLRFHPPPATICLIYDDAHVSDQGCHISNISLIGRECLTSLVNVARYYCVMEQDNGSARKSTFFTRHIYCKYGCVKWCYTQLNPGVLYIDVTTSGLSKRLCTPLGRSYGHLTI